MYQNVQSSQRCMCASPRGYPAPTARLRASVKSGRRPRTNPSCPCPTVPHRSPTQPYYYSPRPGTPLSRNEPRTAHPDRLDHSRVPRPPPPHAPLRRRRRQSPVRDACARARRGILPPRPGCVLPSSRVAVHGSSSSTSRNASRQLGAAPRSRAPRSRRRRGPPASPPRPAPLRRCERGARLRGAAPSWREALRDMDDDDP